MLVVIIPIVHVVKKIAMKIVIVQEHLWIDVLYFLFCLEVVVIDVDILNILIHCIVVINMLMKLKKIKYIILQKFKKPEIIIGKEDEKYMMIIIKKVLKKEKKKMN